MKKIALIFIASIFAFFVNAQVKIGYHYKIKNSYCLGGPLEINYKINDTIIKKVINKRNLKAALKPDTSGKVQIDFWGFKNSSNNNSNTNLILPTDSAANFYFQIEKRNTLGQINKYISIPYAVTNIGAITIPFKYWGGNKNAPNNTSTDFNAGLYIGRKWGRQRFYYDKEKNHESVAFTLAAFAGPSKIEITKTNVKDTSIFKSESLELGLSVGAGSMFTYRNFNIGLFGGWDLPLNTNSKNWVYSKRFWIGFGIGYAVNILNNKN